MPLKGTIAQGCVIGPNGDVLPVPPNMTEPIKYPIAAAGVQAVIGILMPETSEMNISYNKANLHYLNLRKALLPLYQGKWISVNQDGVMIMANSQAEIQRLSAKIFPHNGKDDYYHQCLGCEVSRLATIGGFETLVKPQES